MKYPLTKEQQVAADEVQERLRLKNVTKLDSRELHDHGVWMEYESAKDPERLGEQLELILAFSTPLTKYEAKQTIAKHKALLEQLSCAVAMVQRVADEVGSVVAEEAARVAYQEGKK
jgi:hypothetical protein